MKKKYSLKRNEEIAKVIHNRRYNKNDVYVFYFQKIVWKAIFVMPQVNYTITQPVFEFKNTAWCVYCNIIITSATHFSHLKSLFLLSVPLNIPQVIEIRKGFDGFFLRFNYKSNYIPRFSIPYL